MIKKPTKLKYIKEADDFEFDYISYQDETIYQWDKEQIEAFQLDFIKKSFDYHYKHNGIYKNFCDVSNVSPIDIVSFADLSKIPQIPTSIFKKYEIVSGNVEVEKVCTSSGTQGFVSKIMRSEQTLDRLLNSVTVGMKEFFDLEHDQAIVANLGPDTDESGDVWFSYIMSIIDLFFDTKHFVKDAVFEIEEFIHFVNHFKSDKTLMLIGAPVMFKHVLDYVKVNNISIQFPAKTIINTAGGWKKNEFEKIERDEFEELLSSVFGVDKRYIFDSYNQVELNSVLFECEHKNKHIPPWIKVMIRDPITLEPSDDLDIGIISYLDPSAESYPCFILSDDFGKLSEKCPCGRKGYILKHIRRVSKVETKGCAIRIGKLMEGK